MPSAEHTISEPKLSNVGQLHFEVTLMTAAGEPATGVDVSFAVQGDGSLTPTHDAKEMRRETNAAGVARVTWYRRGIFGRDVKSTLSASAPDGLELTLRLLTADEVVAGPHTSWTPQTHRFGR